ncbi:LacI family DNA-binding transcriptional regulator [Streptomyces sp. VRA16 Mangrove soil]|uniref:LacI family DNA-binding transcriptional regulator n=1 Tax=Streptomyces sp. VRA16 Mangrove soil TaxID=2817434 RepID=UPI001A9ECB61|nr:LacI family DNA-binding transcriptional regulator [Streptomyces sp. VRA16 Mangrove soil]MBO1330917.1 LacI family DNA-binding transcriptional regulator [Streptomyces sp. VRA16 Mangrove soil]
MSQRKPPAAPARATIRDVAERAGVSVASVSRVLSGNYPVSDDLRRRVLKVVQDLDYVTNAHARSLAGGTTATPTVAILLDDVTGSAFAHVAKGVEDAASLRGWLSLVGTTGGDAERELALVELMRRQGVAAVILLGGAYDMHEYRERMDRFARSLDAAGSHLVLVGRPPLDRDVPVTTVNYDNDGGAYAMAGHLLSAGHRHILVLPGPAELTTAQARLSAARRAFATYGTPFDPDMVRHGPYDYGHGFEAVRACLAGRVRFTAVLAGTDVVAAGAMQALREAGLRVPEDVSVVGYDDIPLASQLTPQLTTVHVPYEEMGHVALRAVADWRRGGDVRRSGGDGGHQVLGTHVVVRQSVLPPAPAR